VNGAVNGAAVGPGRRAAQGMASVVAVLVLGSVGYSLLGLDPLDAVYQTVITVFAVGFTEYGEVDDTYQVFTIGVVLVGTGTVLFTLTMVIDAMVEGRLSDEVRRRRMQQRIDHLTGHTVVCGMGQVGASLVVELRGSGRTVVAVDRDAAALRRVSGSMVEGDATDDAVLARCGVARAGTLVVAMDHDADNLYVTLSARQMNEALFIVARANQASAEAKLLQAGADRVVNPHRIGGARMAALVTQPHVAEFLDVIMHDRELEVRLAEAVLTDKSPFCGRTLADCAIRDVSGATVVAVRRSDGSFDTNPGAASFLNLHDVIIALGTAEQLEHLRKLAEVT
jgi:voltage-gated potassium channel